ncbi:hypothetical protein MNBD_GAMMA06-1787 [hydrothermal vent metagenome]|uniref:Ferritin-like domain-containing protein n=1 Tax=hydrothermal vent metagenome TaxID=652676 RepID=A0A3B0X4P3_9ZZZZ
MNIGSDEKKQIARLLNFLLSAEKIAHSCAAKQSKLCDDKTMKHFFIKQARQEKFHALTFQSAILWLAPKGVNSPAKKQIQQYESILNDAIDNHDLLNSIIGLQVILEGMGNVALSHFNAGFKQRGNGYKKIRNVILAQEDSHYDFGLNHLKTCTSPAQHSNHSSNYLSLINDTLLSMQGLFEYFDEDADEYISEFNAILPAWIHENALYHYSNA